MQHHRVRPGWWVLDLADGSMALYHRSGRNIRIEDPPPRLRGLLAALDGRSLGAVLAEIGVQPDSDDAPVLRAALDQLGEAGVLTEIPRAAVPGWVSPELHERFWLQAAAFEAMGPLGADGWELFRRLREARVAVLGAGGGVGCAAVMMLAAAGVGELVLIDGDVVETSNLTRQLHFETADCGQPKVDVLRRRVEAFSPFTEVEAVRRFLGSEQDATEVLAACRADFLLTCADTPPALLGRWINVACVRLGLPYLGAYQGQVGPMCVPGRTPCLECVETVLRAGNPYYDLIMDALSVTPVPRQPSLPLGPALVATLQVEECIAHLTGAWRPRSLGGMLRVDSPNAEVDSVPRDPACRVCGHRE